VYHVFICTYILDNVNDILNVHNCDFIPRLFQKETEVLDILLVTPSLVIKAWIFTVAREKQNVRPLSDSSTGSEPDTGSTDGVNLVYWAITNNALYSNI
jgi:hypothetical protein